MCVWDQRALFQRSWSQRMIVQQYSNRSTGFCRARTAGKVILNLPVPPVQQNTDGMTQPKGFIVNLMFVY